MESESDFSEPSISAYSGSEYQPFDDGDSLSKKIYTFYNIIDSVYLKCAVMILHVRFTYTNIICFKFLNVIDLCY